MDLKPPSQKMIENFKIVARNKKIRSFIQSLSDNFIINEIPEMSSSEIDSFFYCNTGLNFKELSDFANVLAFIEKCKKLLNQGE